MRKLRKVMALLMTLAMVMGLSLTAFAAETSSIKITNAGNGKFAAVQIVKADPTKDTGWEIVEQYQGAFTTAFGVNDTQEIIKGMIYSVSPTASEGEAIERFDQKYQDALKTICDGIDTTNGVVASGGTATLNLRVASGESTAGVWAIGASETGYNYSPMAAYIDFEGTLTPEINAKKAPNQVGKSPEEGDEVAEIGKEVTYKITSTVPYVPLTNDNRTYKVTDIITNGSYVTSPIGEVELKATLTNGTTTEEKTFKTRPVVQGSNQETFIADLSSLLEDNQYANWNITITYSAIVKGIQVNNDVSMDGSHTGEFGQDSTDVYTGTVTLTKTSAEDSTPLADAKFVVKSADGKYATFTKDSDENYVFTGEWVDEYKVGDSDPDGFLDSTVVTTDGNGKAVVKGFDNGATYTFVEVEAPEDYSLADDENVVWSDTAENNNMTGTVDVVDTKLAELPGTGGIGTTIFTIGGCVIMIAAAGLYFASRRKHGEN